MSETDLRSVGDIVEKSLHPEDLFGILVGDKKEQIVLLKHQYKRLMDVVHPDRYPTDKKLFAMAQTAFVKATELYHAAELKINAGTYGDRNKAAEAPKIDQDPPPAVAKIGDVTYNLKRRFAQGDLCDLYICTYIPPVTKTPAAPPAPKTVWSELMEPDEDVASLVSTATFKIVRNRQDNDLLDNEAAVLKVLYPVAQRDEKYFRYLPKLLDSFTYRGKGAGNRRVNLLTHYEGFFSMSEVLGTYPKGLDYRDVVWMFKRLLIGLGYVHTKGYVHGAVILPHVLVHPVTHGARILDWSYALKISEKKHIQAISKAYRTYYPPEVLAKKPATPSTDIFMAAKCFVAMVGGDVATGRMPDAVPQPIRNFISGCLIASQSARPDDAWKLHDELKDLLEKVVGKPTYRPLAMPPAAKA